jgi:hypothetical protein
LAERVVRLMSVPAIGPLTALTWALQIAEVQRLCSIKKAVSYRIVLCLLGFNGDGRIGFQRLAERSE